MEAADHQTTSGSIKLTSRGWFAFFTGLNLAFFVCYMMCKPSSNHAHSWIVRLGTAIGYLLVVCCAGTLGTWIMLPGESRPQLRTLLHGGFRGWIFLPAIALFLQLESIWAQLLAVAMAALMAMYLYRSTATPEPPGPSPQSLFAADIQIAPSSWLPFVLSLLFYAALLSTIADRIVLATALLAAITFLLVLRLKSIRAPSDRTPRPTHPIVRKAQPYLLFAAAFYLILISLSSTPNQGFSLFGLPGLPSSMRQPKLPSDPHPPSTGYRTIVIWPPEKPKEVIAPPPPKGDAPSTHAAKPMVIQFFGPYWYFKYPGELPGPNTRSSHGDPLKANVRSTDSYPLLMEAHQHLGDPIDLACCREIQIVFQNDVSTGAIAVGISLSNSLLPAKLSEDLGMKVVPPHPSDLTLPPTEETLTFLIPKHGAIQSFDDINVTFLPDPRHRTAGRRVAVERFILIPN